jgi:hypothetical protein
MPMTRKVNKVIETGSILKDAVSVYDARKTSQAAKKAHTTVRYSLKFRTNVWPLAPTPCPFR